MGSHYVTERMRPLAEHRITGISGAGLEQEPAANVMAISGTFRVLTTKLISAIPARAVGQVD